MTYSLVCEGGCNPLLVMLDDEVKDYRRSHSVKEYIGTLPEDLLTKLRELRHTTHVSTDQATVFQCWACGHERRYGQHA